MTSSEQLKEIRSSLGLEPLPLEGGHFRQTWRGEVQSDGRPSGTAILALVSTIDDDFSAMHRLPINEIWYYHSGDPVELLLLHPSRQKSEVVLLGDNIAAGEVPQLVIPAGTWMGGQAKGDLGWALFSCSTDPGYVDSDYEGGDAAALAAEFPEVADHIVRLCRPGVPLRHPSAD